MNELIIGGIGLITTFISGWTSWFFARKKYNTEVDSNYIENLTKALETYDSIIAHNKAEIDSLIRENVELKGEISELRRQVLDLTTNICLDLTCELRTREKMKRRRVDGKAKDRLDKTEGPDTGGHKSSGEERDTCK